MIDQQMIKLSIGLAIITALVGFWKWSHDAAWQAGYDSGQAEQLAAYGEAEKEAQKKLAEAIEDRDKWQKKAIELQNRKPKVVVKYVEKIVENNPDCTELHGFSDLWNQYAD